MKARRRLWSAPLIAAGGAGLLLVGLFLTLGEGAVRADVGGPPMTPTSATLYVSAYGGDDANDCSQAAPCATIQHAVEVAAEGDTILVAAQEVELTTTFPPTPITHTNIYSGGGENVVLFDKSLIVEGNYVRTQTGAWVPGVQLAQIDGEGVRRPVAVEGVTVTLRGFELRNGSATYGGGLYAHQATLKPALLSIHDNHATYGGGIALRDSRVSVDTDPLLQGMVRVGNNSADYGGGLYVEGGSPLLSGLWVESNQADVSGGGFFITGGRPTILAGVVQNNAATTAGGGFYLDGTPARLAGLLVLSNTAQSGAGLYVDGPFGFSEGIIPIFANNYFRFNRAVDAGGAIYFNEAIAGLVNNIVAQNSAEDGAALYLYASSPQLFHTTVASNTGASGIYITHRPGSIWPPVPPLPSLPAFTNTILSGQTTAVYLQSTGLPDPFQNHLTMEGTLWWENGTDVGGHPELVSREDDVAGDPRYTCTGQPPACLKPFHILTDSAAMDAGVPVALTLPGTDLFVDIDLETRPSGEGYDIGADEVISDEYSVWLVPPFETRAITPGGTITYVHQLINSGKETDTYTITVGSGHGWATLLTSPQVTVGTMQSTTVMVGVTVPEDAADGITDTLFITATSHADPDIHREALDLTRVVSSTDFNLTIIKRADRAQARTGEPLGFTVRVTKTGEVSGTVTVVLGDHTEPFTMVEGIGVPSNCEAVTATGTITCTWAIAGASDLVTREVHFVITPTATYSGLVINTARIGSDRDEMQQGDNQSVALVGVGGATSRPVYLPLVLKNYRASTVP